MPLPEVYGSLIANRVGGVAVLGSKNRWIIEPPPGILIGLSVTLDRTLIRAAEAYAMVGTTTISDSLEAITNILISSYLGSESIVGWTGRLVLAQDEAIFMWSWNALTAHCKLVAKIETR